MKTIKSMAELYALGSASFKDLEEVCGGRVPEVVFNYVQAYIREYNAAMEYAASQDALRTAEIELDENIDHVITAYVENESGKTQLTVGMSLFIPAQTIKERIKK